MKLQVSANDQMVEKIDFYAGLMSVSRSALCAMLIGQGLMGLDKAREVVDHMVPDLEKAAKEQSEKP